MSGESSRLSLKQLLNIFEQRKSQINLMKTRRGKIERNLAEIDAEIARREGSAPGRQPRPRASGKRSPHAPKVTLMSNCGKSLKKWVIEVLTSSSDGLTVSEVQEAVLNAGYNTCSVNFKNTLYQCLYQNRDAFVSKNGRYCLTRSAAASVKKLAKT